MKQEYKFSFAYNGAIIERVDAGFLYVAEYATEKSEVLGGIPMDDPSKIVSMLGSLLYEDIDEAVKESDRTDFDITITITPQGSYKQKKK